MTRTGRALAALLFALYIVQCLLYIASTSVVEENQRYFLLWDDAMISMQYAKNLALGNGLVWVAGEEPVQGFTNLGTTLLMALLHWLPGSDQAAALFFQLVNLACLLGVVFYSFRLADELFENPWPAYGAAGMTALYGPLNIWSLQGSDSGLLALFTLMVLVDLVRAHKSGARPPLRMYVALAAGVLVRQDFSLVPVLVVAFEFFSARQLGLGARVLRAAPAALSLVAVWAGLLLFSQWYYGDPLPNTYYLKATGNPRGLVLLSGLSQLIGVFSGRGLVALLLLLAGAVFLLRHERRNLCVLLFALIGIYHAYYVWAGGDWIITHTSRYLVPVMPLFIVMLCGGAWLATGRLRERQVPAAGVGGLYVALLAVAAFSLNPSATLDEWHLRSVEPMYKTNNRNNVHFGRSICRYTSGDATVGLFWAGVPAYVCARKYIDLLGRTDRHIAKLHVEGFAGPGHAKWDWDYIVNERKTEVIATLTPELQPRPDFEAQYCLARMPRPNIVIAVRKDARHKLLDRDLRLCQTYPYPPCRDCRL